MEVELRKIRDIHFAHRMILLRELRWMRGSLTHGMRQSIRAIAVCLWERMMELRYVPPTELGLLNLACFLVAAKYIVDHIDLESHELLGLTERVDTKALFRWEAELLRNCRIPLKVVEYDSMPLWKRSIQA